MLDGLRNTKLSSGTHVPHTPGDAQRDVELLGWGRLVTPPPPQHPPQPPANLVGRRIAIHLVEPMVLADPTSTETLLPGLCYGRLL